MTEQWFGEKKIITLALAKRLTATAESEIGKRGWSMFVTIADDSGTPVLVTSVNRPQLASFEVSVAKARAAVHFRRPTKAWEDRVLAGFPNAMSIPGVLAAEGGVPLAVDGQIVGAIGVSGGTSAEDGVIAAAVIETLKELL